MIQYDEGCDEAIFFIQKHVILQKSADTEALPSLLEWQVHPYGALP